MIIYSITFSIDPNIEKDWITFIKDDFIPIFNKTGYFKESKLMKLLNEELASEGITYSLQHRLESMDDLKDFRENYEESVEEGLHKKFGGRFAFFKTWLEEV